MDQTTALPEAPPQDDLAAENARLRAALQAARVRAELQALRAAAQAGVAAAARHEVTLIRSSTAWKVTAPLRLAMDLARGLPPTSGPEAQLLRRLLSAWRHHGARAALDQARAWRRRQAPAARKPAAPVAGIAAADAPASPLPPPVPAPSGLLRTQVLIIAELTLPQCAKYRVWQKQELFARLGVDCRVVDWRDRDECIGAAALATQVILYRVPGFPPVLNMIETLRDMGLPLAWEVDDLIFDRAQYLQNQNIYALPPEQTEAILSGVAWYAAAMKACGRGIASTPHLAEAMRRAGLAHVDVVENALDAETLEAAARIRALPRARDGVLVAYGSGTKTHDADFRVAAPALLRLLAARGDVRLRIVGELNLPDEFAAFGDRVERLPPAQYTRYLELLGEADISIAPLEQTLFNDAKSNIKFLEAAILGLPSVCSPAANFTAVITDGVDGFLAGDGDAWFAALNALAGDAALRARLGQAALEKALARYAPDAVAQAQVAPLVVHGAPTRPALKIMLANVYFAPRSYGGATLVVEELAARLRAMPGVGVDILTSLDDSSGGTRSLRRTRQDGMPVFAIPVNAQDIVTEFDDPLVGAEFGRVLDAVRPDVVHLHAIQWLSLSLAEACRARGIPYVITLHDAWWLCARQFMVRADGQACHQVVIDQRVCQACLPGARHLPARDALMRDALAGAALLLSPSEAHRQFYIANGVAPQRIRVAPNGVRKPAPGFTRKPGDVLRFAYVGGNVDIKGYSVVRRAFTALARDDWELTLVDNTLNLGFSSVDPADWRLRGRLRVVPAYTQGKLDDFFAGVDVLLFPSQARESFGLTVREALVRDVWVIATGIGGPAEAITEGVNGNLLPLDGRHEPLLAAVTALLDRPGQLRDYRNPLADAIMDFDTQARDLHAMLADVAHQGAPA